MRIADGRLPVDWSRWSVILLKPDCIERGLHEHVLAWISRIAQVRAVRRVRITEEQIFAHYGDLFPRTREIGVDIAAELRRMHVGRQAVIALAHGTDAPARLRALIGPTDPARAGPHTIRGHFGIDSLAAARADGRLTENLIHTSDDATAARRDFAIWYGNDLALLTDPSHGMETRP